VEERVKAVALLDPRQRFEVRGEVIRAGYGHTKKLNIGISYEVNKESKTLYHGTLRLTLQSILREGVKPVSRLYMHLTTSIKDACRVGERF